MPHKPHIVIIGAGVTGLTTALRLQAPGPRGYRLTILARDFPAPFETIDATTQINYTSPWGGAHNRFVLPSNNPGTNSAEHREHEMSLRTFRAMEELHASAPEAGISFVRGVEYFEAPGPEVEGLTSARAGELGIRGFRRLGSEEVPEGVKVGYEYETWCVNPMVYCAFLLRRFTLRGGKVVRREIRDPREVFVSGRELGKVDLVVNCSGDGFGDPDMFITRGQTCLVANSCDATVTRQNADGSWIFCVPRGFEGGTVIGGTKEPDNWDAEPSPAVRERLLKNFAATYPSILGESGQFDVVKDIVGRRPTRRGGMRLEKERTSSNQPIVHAYGLGGRGYELSWGVAEEVAKLVEEETHEHHSRL